MPELPEIETIKNGIKPHLEGSAITGVIVRDRRLRWPVPRNLKQIILGQGIESVDRRGKYLLIKLEQGHLIWHMGMSGTLKIITEPTPPIKHDHIDLTFSNSIILRYNDPRRFGSLHWTTEDPLEHKLLCKLGPEPISSQFTSNHLFKKIQNKNIAIKLLIMNSHIVVGAGNIYANEALFMSGIHPERKSKTLSKLECEKIVKSIKQVLRKAIKAGGTTLKDYSKTDGKPGYFAQELLVYGRGGESCLRCETTIDKIVLGQRATYYCPECQK